jgi:hypothetical protein
VCIANRKIRTGLIRVATFVAVCAGSVEQKKITVFMVLNVGFVKLNCTGLTHIIGVLYSRYLAFSAFSVLCFSSQS